MLNQIAMKLNTVNASLLEIGDIVTAESDSPFAITEFKVHHIDKFKEQAGTTYKLWLFPRKGRKDMYQAWVTPLDVNPIINKIIHD